MPSLFKRLKRKLVPHAHKDTPCLPHLKLPSEPIIQARLDHLIPIHPVHNRILQVSRQRVPAKTKCVQVILPHDILSNQSIQEVMMDAKQEDVVKGVKWRYDGEKRVLTIEGREDHHVMQAAMMFQQRLGVLLMQTAEISDDENLVLTEDAPQPQRS
jgi:hypothetical protein